MRFDECVEIEGDIADVLAVSVPIERWPLLVPFYRRARVMGRYGQSTVLQMSVRWGGLRVGWTTEQMPFPAERRVVYRHLRGLATGLWAEWRAEQGDRCVRLCVSHEWRPTWPVLGPIIAAALCRCVIRPITRNTLQALRQQVESGQAAALRRLEATQER